MAVIAERANRNILRILFTFGPLRGAEIGKRLEEIARIRYKSTSSLTETLQRLGERGLIERENSLYFLSKLAREKWIIKFLNLLVKEKIDRGNVIRIKKVGNY